MGHRRDSYHHGDLPAVVLAAVDDLVREGGIGAVSLREAARRVGVSHTAPAHHFGDKAGLLTAFATEGFERFTQRLRAAQAAGADDLPVGTTGLAGIGLAYVRFAFEDRAHFEVMFRPEHLRAGDPVFREASDAAFGVLVDAVREVRDDLDPDDPRIVRAATGAWSIVHGFATLWLAGNLPDAVTSQAPDAAAAAVLESFGELVFAAAAG